MCWETIAVPLIGAAGSIGASATATQPKPGQPGVSGGGPNALAAFAGGDKGIPDMPPIPQSGTTPVSNNDPLTKLLTQLLLQGGGAGPTSMARNTGVM